ncbi:MAG: trigger factor [Holosporales bacterium]|jgi:trigger factor|nr:trigger factor [Holosporales bacterium]
MQVDKKENSSLSVTYTITVSSAEISEEIDKWIAKKASTVKMDGFRKGKVPLDVVTKHFLDEAKPAAIEGIIKRAHKDIIESEKLSLVSDPELKIKSYEDGGDLVVEMSVETRPQFELKDHKNIHIEKVVCEVSQEEFDEAYSVFIQGFRAAVSVDSPAEDGDIVTLNYETFIGKSRLKKLCNDNASISAGSNSNLFEVDFFEKALRDLVVGMRPGEEKQQNITFPKNFANKDLRAKCALVKVKVLEVRRSQHVELTEETVKHGYLKFDSLKELEDYIWRKLRMWRQKQINLCNKRAILDALSEMYTFEVPPSFVEADFEKAWKSMEKDVKKARENDDEDVRGKTDEDIMQECRDVSYQRLRVGFVLMEVFQAEKDAFSAEFIENWLNERFVYSDALLYIAKQSFACMKEFRAALIPEVVEDFAVYTLLQKVTSTERVVTPKELLDMVADTVMDDDLSQYDWRTIDIFCDLESEEEEEKDEKEDANTDETDAAVAHIAEELETTV